jgi:hypothetical protein
MKHFCIEYSSNPIQIVIKRDYHHGQYDSITSASRDRLHHIANEFCNSESLGKSELKIHTGVYVWGWAVFTSKVLPGNRVKE